MSLKYNSARNRKQQPQVPCKNILASKTFTKSAMVICAKKFLHGTCFVESFSTKDESADKIHVIDKHSLIVGGGRAFCFLTFF